MSDVSQLGTSESLKWGVYYAEDFTGPWKHVADEYGNTAGEIERLILHEYSDEETPLGFYKLRPEIGGVEYLVHKSVRPWDRWLDD